LFLDKLLYNIYTLGKSKHQTYIQTNEMLYVSGCKQSEIIKQQIKMK
jgi:hypothetical protein